MAPDVEKRSRSIRKIIFDLPEGSSYETGDHLCVYPLNLESMVQRFLKCFGFELSSAARKQEGFPHGADCSSDVAVKWQSEQLFELYYIESDEKDPADVFFETPTCLRDLLSEKVDLSLSARNAVDVLLVFKKHLDELTAKAGKDNTALDDLLADDIIQRFYTLTSGILEQDSENTTEAIDDFVAQYPSIVAFLEDFRELFLTDFVAINLGLKKKISKPAVPLAEILVILPRLQPRYYSISSSSKTGKPKQVTITVGVLKEETRKGVLIEGVCSHYLQDLKPGTDRAKISVSTSSFRLPEDQNAPILMVGTGTGLAPMLGFLDDKSMAQKESNVGPVHLFFGCCTESDFIYKDVVNQYGEDKLIELHLALSRSTNVPKKYVQHKIADMGQRACELLQQKDTHYYVCGDARMADECFEACIEVLRKHAVISRVGAVQYLRQMQLEGRWQTDVWGIVSDFENSKKEIGKKKKMKAKLWLSRLASGTDDL